MAKLSLISLNVLLVFALKIFFGGDVTIVQKMQPNIRPGDTLMVELEITKGDREGFAKWQQRLPQGFIASSIETNGATFSFKNQEIKVIWMALPEKETFSIKYKIETSTETNGDYNLLGKFSYIEENERKDVASEVFILTIGENAVAVKQTESNESEKPSFGEGVLDKASDKTTTEADNTEALSDKIVTEPTEIADNSVKSETPSNSSTDNTIITQAAKDGTASIIRKVKHIGQGNYEVTLNISKGNLNSFGKVEDYLPPDYTASENTSYQGIFSFKGNVVKILWMTLPTEENIAVTYNLKSTSDELDSAIIHGVFSYLNVDESNQTKLAPTKFRNFLAEASLADEAIKSENKNPNEDSPTEQLANRNTSDQNTEEEKIVVEESEVMEEIEEIPMTEDELVSEITNVPSPETSVSYKVQIAAAKKEVTQQYFIDRHNITEPISIEYHESWYKYTLGGYDIYKAARNKRNDIWAANNKVNDAFVTAYNAGERISVQEALMISKQKWFK
ncbi:MAG: hypothetical protein JKY48_19125 [Flavobacteriales bacterium]|nr:hypothetical protein [Flavobacteriales bacterium]